MKIIAICTVVLLLMLITGIYFIASKKHIILGRIFTIFSTAVISFFSAMYACLILLFSSKNGSFYSALVLLMAAWIIASAACASFGLFRKRKVLIPLVSILAAYILSFSGFEIYRIYQENIPTVSEGDNLLMQYEPYGENTRAVSLNTQASVHFAMDIPVMDGATALYPVYASFAKAVYPKAMLKGTDNRVLQCSKTGGAYRSIVRGDSDIIFAAEPSEEQKEYAKEKGVELCYTPIGKEAFVFFVNAQNPVDDISIEDIQKIYSGEITDWSQLGADGIGKITAFQRDEGSGSQSALLRLMGDIPLADAPTENVVDGMGGIIERAADYKNYKNAIGFSFRFYSTEMVKNNSIKLLKINGVAPTAENIENGTYPISSYFYAVTRKDASENTLRLLEWVQSDEGQKIVELVGYTPVNKNY